MTLPFNNNNNSRKYQCFCCGMEFEEYYEFKEHLLEEHEEGREYIVCPLEHCQAPVRDMKMHFKAKHPSFDFKKYKGQNRAIIWHDFKGKKKKTRKPKFKQGTYTSTKTGKAIKYRSGLEEKVYKILDQHDNVLSFYAEPFKVPYLHQGHAHDYIPDLFITFMDGHKELWEVKPSSQTTLEVNKNKWEAAKEACKVRGWKFEVYTEKRIEQLGKTVQRQIID